MYGYTTEEFRQLSIGVLSEGNPPYSQEGGYLNGFNEASRITATF